MKKDELRIKKEKKAAVFWMRPYSSPKDLHRCAYLDTATMVGRSCVSAQIVSRENAPMICVMCAAKSWPSPPKRSGRRHSTALPSMVVISRYALLAAFALAVVALTGCAGYELGAANGLAARGRSVQINPFQNKTVEPRLTDAVTMGLREYLQKDGTYALASHNDGDVIVSGEILRYDRLELAFTPQNVLTVSDYRLSVTAHVIARERVSGKVLFDKAVSGFTLIRVGSDLPDSERQAMPLLGLDLAKNVTALLVEGSW